ncbi:MAG: thioredoxin domain-containing protein [Gammaproteobacteria bacterium]|nr:thioredoxin domain-containing protein [Gammaproteobacteria bacterium]
MLTDAPRASSSRASAIVLIEDPRRVRGDAVEIMEFFSYACVHCYNFDRELNQWVEGERGSDRVRSNTGHRQCDVAPARSHVLRAPGAGSSEIRTMQRSFGQSTTVASGLIPSIALSISWARVACERAFRSMFNSPLIDSKMEQADRMARRMRVATVPTIVVDGKYLVRTTATVGPSRMLEVMDHLVEKASTPAG